MPSFAEGYGLPVAEALTAKEPQIVAELIGAQGHSTDVGGYYHPSPEKCSAAMRPSATLNGVLATLAD